MWFSIQFIYITALWIINDIPVHEYFYRFCVLQSKIKQKRILISLQSTSCCLNASLSVNTEKSGSADLLITTTHRQGNISHRYGHIHTVCLWEYVGECKGIYSISQMGVCSRNIHCIQNPEQSSQSDRNWFQTHFQDIMFNNQKQAIFNDYMAFFLLDMESYVEKKKKWIKRCLH